MPVVGTKYNGTLKSGVATFNNVTGNAGTTITPSSLTAYMFGRNANGTASNFFIGRIYDCQIKDNGTLVRDFIPAIDENNVPYMFDKVTHSAFLNAGTGNFTYGSELDLKDKVRFIQDDIPNIYKKVRYIEASGTQYIDTGYTPTNTTGQYAKMQYTTVNNAVTFGGMVSGNGVVGPYYATSSGGYWWIRWGTNEPKVAASSPTTTDTYEMYLNFNNDRIAKVNNITLSNNLGSISGNYPTITLFRRNFSAGYAYLSGKIYSYKITSGTTLVGDFIPVVRKADNKPGMYDKVTKQFFTNQGTGEFTYPIN